MPRDSDRSEPLIDPGYTGQQVEREMTRLVICIEGRPELLRQLGLLAGDEPADARDTGPRLTNREWEVARLLVSGSTNEEIARRMVLSRRTVEKHMDNIRRKLGVTSRGKVMAWTMRHDDGERVLSTQYYAERYV
jgi:DNA-binding NarL/FixJ family response regulator